MLGIQGLAHCACCCDAMGILLSEDKLELIVIAAVSSAVTATMVGEVQAMFSGMLKHMHKVTFPVLAGFACIDNYSTNPVGLTLHGTSNYSSLHLVKVH